MEPSIEDNREAQNCHLRSARAYFRSHTLAPPPCRAGLSPWLALWYGIVSQWLSGHYLEYSPRNSFSNLKQHYSAALGLGALLSIAPLEEALYKCLQ